MRSADSGIVTESPGRKYFLKYPLLRLPPPPPQIQATVLPIRIPSRIHTTSSTSLPTVEARSFSILGSHDKDTPDNAAKIKVPKRQGNGGYGRRVRVPTNAMQRDIMAKLGAISERSWESGRVASWDSTPKKSSGGTGSKFFGSMGEVMNVVENEGKGWVGESAAEEFVVEDEGMNVGSEGV